MLDIKELEYWISRYENEADKLDHVVTLSALYHVRDELAGKQQTERRASGYSRAAAAYDPLDVYGDSEFLQAVEGKEQADAWAVMDELMDTLAAVNPKVYDGVMRKLYRL